MLQPVPPVTPLPPTSLMPLVWVLALRIYCAKRLSLHSLASNTRSLLLPGLHSSAATGLLTPSPWPKLRGVRLDMPHPDVAVSFNRTTPPSPVTRHRKGYGSLYLLCLRFSLLRSALRLSAPPAHVQKWWEEAGTPHWRGKQLRSHGVGWAHMMPRDQTGSV